MTIEGSESAAGDPGSLAVGVDLGGTNLRIAAFTSKWEQAAFLGLATRVSDGPEAVASDICKGIHQVLDSCRDRVAGRNERIFEDLVSGVGIGCPGPLELPSGTFRSPPNLPGFDGFSLKDAVESCLQRPVHLECDANAAALAEWKYGAGKQMPVDSMCMLTLGTGVGGGIVLDRRIWHGANGMGGEAGHIPIVPGGLPCGCGARGCLEQYASATAIWRAAKELANRGDAPGIAQLLGCSNARDGDARDLAHLARAGDEQAQQLFAQLGAFLGKGLAALVNTLNLSLYAIGGGVASAWDLFAPAMFDELRSSSYVYRLTEPAPDQSYAWGKTHVVRAELGGTAGLLGAAMLPGYARTAEG